MTNFTCQSKSFINIFSTCQVSASEQQPFSCHNLANDVYSETAKTVFSHLKHVTQVKDVGVTISSDLTWETHINTILGKANRILAFFAPQQCYVIHYRPQEITISHVCKIIHWLCQRGMGSQYGLLVLLKIPVLGMSYDTQGIFYIPVNLQYCLLSCT